VSATLASIAIALSESPVLALILKSTLALAAGVVAARLARTSAASVRHAILAAAFAASLLVPIATVLLPTVAIALPVAASRRVEPPPPAVATPRMDRPLTTTTETESPMTISDTALASALWAAGAIVFSLSFAAGVWELRRIRRTALPWLDARPTIAALADRAGVTSAVEVLLHEDIDVPMTCGFRRPAVILPADATAWDSDALRRALVHELEHVRRRDWWMHVAARAVCGVYWFNPLAWVAYRQLTLEAERACDDAVVANEEGTQYAEQLVALARRLSSREGRPALAMANRSDLSRRVTAVLNDQQVRGRAGLVRTSLVTALAATLALAIAPMRVVGAGITRLDGETTGEQQPRTVGKRLISRIDRALVEAVDEGDMDDVRSLLDSGASVNARVDGDGSPLIAAARNGNMTLVRFLLDRGADPSMGVEGDGNPLIMAAREGHLSIVQLLLDKGADVNQVVDGDENALIQASGEGHLEVVKLLAARGADVNARVWADSAFERPNGEWRTPLSMARRGGHRAVVEFLLANGASQ
jgi:beta-lactamase regulating signal transducer with metallopeptidase domain